MSNKSFANVSGHQSTKNQLELLIKNQQIPHALLLSGPSQVGKTHLMLILAQILQEASIPNQSIHIFNETTSFKIKEMRELQKKAYLTTNANYQIFVIKNIERFTLPASNAFLKLLEEPPSKVKFLLTTSNEVDLLPTIRSRCQALRIGNLSPNELSEFAKTHFPEQEVTPDLLRFSLGKPGRLKQLIETPEFHQKLINWYNQIEELDGFNLNHKHFLLTKELSSLTREEIIEFLNIYQLFVHEQRGAKRNPSHWAQKVKQIQITINELKQNLNPQLALEQMLILQLGS